MKNKKHKRRMQRTPPPLNLRRYFKDGEVPTYKKWEVLANFVTERGKILPRSRTSIDAKTQRKLTREIKRARHLALLPFVVKPL